jgi:hypothetical protein
VYRWRKEYGGRRVDQARRLNELEGENSRQKKLVADLTLDKMILQESSKVNFQVLLVAANASTKRSACCISASAAPD